MGSTFVELVSEWRCPGTVEDAAVAVEVAVVVLRTEGAVLMTGAMIVMMTGQDHLSGFSFCLIAAAI